MTLIKNDLFRPPMVTSFLTNTGTWKRSKQFECLYENLSICKLGVRSNFNNLDLHIYTFTGVKRTVVNAQYYTGSPKKNGTCMN